MDPQSIDQAYNELQQEFNEVSTALQGLAGKLSSAASAGDAHAQEWLLDLKGLALNLKSEQMQVQNLLTQIHAFVDSQHQQYQQMPAYQQQYGGGMGGMGGRGGGLGGFLNSNFGRAIEWGAGFGLGDDLINSIF
jgi:gamma-glutamyl:cysteine ligase YbdK (ATP-grasp superfamily)